MVSRARYAVKRRAGSPGMYFAEVGRTRAARAHFQPCAVRRRAAAATLRVAGTSWQQVHTRHPPGAAGSAGFGTLIGALRSFVFLLSLFDDGVVRFVVL
mgnify:CR=1 FL=1